MSSLTSGPVKNTYLIKVITQADADLSGTVSLEELQAFESAHQEDGFLSLIEPEALDRKSQAKGLANATAMLLKEYELFQQATTGGAGVSTDGIATLAGNDLDKSSVSNRDIAKAQKSILPKASTDPWNGMDHGDYNDVYNNTNPYGPIALDRGMDDIFATSNMLVQQNAQFLDGYQAPPPAAKTVADAALASAPTEETKKKGWWYRLWHKE